MSDLRVFKRYEIKYMLSREQFEAFFGEYGNMLVPDEYHESLIQNIYYDTENFRLVRESLDKPVYKEKLRLRCYNEIKPGEKAYLEIKKKYEGIVYKRRERIVIDEAEAALAGKGKAESQIGKELEWFIKYYGNLRPAMYLSYKRKAWLVKGSDIRITFDSEITWRTKELDLLKGSYGELLHSDGRVLMEVKCGEALPIEFIRLLEKYNIYPTSFSKYGSAYAVLMQREAKKVKSRLPQTVSSREDRQYMWGRLGRVAGA